MSKATVEIRVKRRGYRVTSVEFDNEMDAEKLYLDLTQHLKNNDLVGDREIKRTLDR